MTKYKFSNGFAIAPEKTMRMLEKMSRSGWHLTGMSGLRYKFEKGENHDYIYDYNMEDDLDEEMLSLYESSGWHLVLSESGFQIFRAEKGATPLFTDCESKLEIIIQHQKRFGIAALVSISLFILCVGIESINSNIISFVFLLFFLCCSIFTLFPFIGLCHTFIKTKYQKSDK